MCSMGIHWHTKILYEETVCLYVILVEKHTTYYAELTR